MVYGRLVIVPVKMLSFITKTLIIGKSLDPLQSFIKVTFLALRLWNQSLIRGRHFTHTTMISERLNGIALMHVYQEILPDTKKVIELFATINRRLNFI